MKKARRHGNALSITLLALVLGGCSVRGSPSYALFGAYFPAWMFCAGIGVAGAVGARIAFVAGGLGNVLPFQLFVCASIGLIIALLVWLLWFGF
jgi:hypothetical protein